MLWFIQILLVSNYLLLFGAGPTWGSQLSEGQINVTPPCPVWFTESIANHTALWKSKAAVYFSILWIQIWLNVCFDKYTSVFYPFLLTFFTMLFFCSISHDPVDLLRNSETRKSQKTLMMSWTGEKSTYTLIKTCSI